MAADQEDFFKAYYGFGIGQHECVNFTLKMEKNPSESRKILFENLTYFEIADLWFYKYERDFYYITMK